MNISLARSTYMVFCNYLVPEHFYHPPKKPCSPKAFSVHFLTCFEPLMTPNLPSFSVDLPTFNISY